jgi:UDP-N-acetylmuramate dehydrogenase
MELLMNFPLKSLNTFNINVDGKYFTGVASVEEIREVIAHVKAHGLPLLVLGGGSNLLFTQSYPGLVMKINLMGMAIEGETGEDVVVKAGSGETWDDFVGFSVSRGYWGLENLSLIPGSVGASPVQNIGAYGVEMKDRFISLEFYDFESGEILEFEEKDCHFGYRDSIFKNELKGKGVVLSVSFRLSKTPVYETGYGSVADELESMGVKDITPAALRTAVINIRRSKLPDPTIIGNAGSFFKNPTIDAEQHKELAARFPGLVSFPQPGNRFKLAAGWLIDQCGWKGYRNRDAGVHDRQALVLVNHGKATGKELFELSEKIRGSVNKTFGVDLEREVNVI